MTIAIMCPKCGGEMSYCGGATDEPQWICDGGPDCPGLNEDGIMPGCGEAVPVQEPTP